MNSNLADATDEETGESGYGGISISIDVVGDNNEVNANIDIIQGTAETEELVDDDTLMSM